VPLTRTYDTIPPTISISAPSQTIATSSQSVTYTITYGGADIVPLATALTGSVTLITTGTAAGTITASGTGTTERTITVSSLTGNGTLGISIMANTASDLAGNQAPAAGPSATFIVDNTPPTVLISSTTGTATSAAPIPVTVHFSKPVTGFTGSSVTVTNGSLGSFAGSGADYSFEVTPQNNRTISIGIAANVAQDAAGNWNIAATSLTVQSSAGDLNGDNTVDAADALMGLRIAVGLDAATTPELFRGDVAPLINGTPTSDGTIDLNDVVVLLKMSVGLL
jgi:hypothetical protein